MRTLTISGGNLVRITLVAGYVALAILLGLLAAGLSFAGYVLFLVGTTKGALFLWGCAVLPLVLIGVLGTLLSQRIHKPRADDAHPRPQPEAIP